MGAIGNFFSAILAPLEWVVATIMVAFHSVLTTLGMPAASGWTWAFSIIGLVIVIRIILIPLFVKQIRASRGMQLIQPEIQKIQKKYKGKTDPASRQAMTQETMALYKESGTNPFASCLPILLQSPVFFALYRVLRNIADSHPHAIGPFSLQLIHQADRATLFGARLSDKFIGAETNSTKVLTAVLIVLMSLSTFTTQRQLMTKNMPASAMDNPFAKQQKMLMYVLPFFFFITGPNFPIGVLLYWLTTNIWSMGQQFYVIRRMPAPGSQAERELEERRARKAGKSGGTPETTTGTTGSDGIAVLEAGPVGGQRQQPKRNQPRKKRATKAVGPAAGDGPDPASDAGSAGSDPHPVASEDAADATPEGAGSAGPSTSPGSTSPTAPKATPSAKSGKGGGPTKPAPSNGSRKRGRPGQGSSPGKPGSTKTS